MALTYEEALQFPVSVKKVFAVLRNLVRVYDWTLTGVLYYTPFNDDLRMVSMTERVQDGDALEMQAAASQAALEALDTSVVGGWWYSQTAGIVLVNPKDGTTAFDNKYVSTVDFPVSISGGELDGEAYDPRLSRAPGTTQQGSEILDGRVARIGAGQTTLTNTDAFMIENELEPDGNISVQRQLGILR